MQIERFLHTNLLIFSYLHKRIETKKGAGGISQATSEGLLGASQFFLFFYFSWGFEGDLRQKSPFVNEV